MTPKKQAQTFPISSDHGCPAAKSPVIMSKMLSRSFRVRSLTAEDIDSVLRLFEGNPLYFSHCPPAPSRDGILEDMRALPPGKKMEDKYYLGFFDGEKLAAVIDLIAGYPQSPVVFIGLFMVDKEYQGHGTGSRIIQEVLAALKETGFTRARLGYIRGNPQSEAFWIKNGFEKTGVGTARSSFAVICMEKAL